MKDEIKKLLDDGLDENLIRITVSNPQKKDGVQRIKIRPIELRGGLYFQCESFTKTQAFQKNLKKEEASSQILEWMGEFRQLQMETVQYMCTVLISKKGKVTIQKKAKKNAELEQPRTLAHNRKKTYILEEGSEIPYLVALGVMTPEGKVIHRKFDKFKQINRFLEFIEDVVPILQKIGENREITILDFGCGKSYLTFAMYHYLHVMKGYDVRMIGLDLKKEVIEHCNRLSKEFGYDKLEFLQGDIADYFGVEQVDMVVTLHACDTATDIALSKAVAWNASVILSVPCCQHELNGQIKSETLASVMRYGLIKERVASLVTDALRAEYLVQSGYEAQVLEFIDMEHTPKNILIRAVKRQGREACDSATQKEANGAKQRIQDCEEFFGLSPSLKRLLSR